MNIFVLNQQKAVSYRLGLPVEALASDLVKADGLGRYLKNSRQRREELLAGCALGKRDGELVLCEAQEGIAQYDHEGAVKVVVSDELSPEQTSTKSFHNLRQILRMDFQNRNFSGKGFVPNPQPSVRICEISLAKALSMLSQKC